MRQPDFLDEMIAESEARDPNFQQHFAEACARAALKDRNIDAADDDYDLGEVDEFELLTMDEAQQALGVASEADVLATVGSPCLRLATWRCSTWASRTWRRP